jgi:hypothetical protein
MPDLQPGDNLIPTVVRHCERSEAIQGNKAMQGNK